MIRSACWLVHGLIVEYTAAVVFFFFKAKAGNNGILFLKCFGFSKIIALSRCYSVSVCTWYPEGPDLW